VVPSPADGIVGGGATAGGDSVTSPRLGRLNSREVASWRAGQNVLNQSGEPASREPVRVAVER
jgi:hypothetical protein